MSDVRQFKTKDAVLIYPVGKPDRASEAKIVLASENQVSLAVEFEDKPNWSVANGFLFNRESEKVTMLLLKEEGQYRDLQSGHVYIVQHQVKN